MQGVTQGAYAIIIWSPSGALAPSRCRCAGGRRAERTAAVTREPAGAFPGRDPVSEIRNKHAVATSRVSLIKAVELHFCRMGTAYSLFMPGYPLTTCTLPFRVATVLTPVFSGTFF